MLTLLLHIWPHILAAAIVIIATVAAGHAVMYKRESRSAVGWTAVILMMPLAGPLLYFLFGINRIQRRAARLRARPAPASLQPHPLQCPPDDLRSLLPPECRHLSTLARVGDEITKIPLLRGNRIWPLQDGDGTYPAMLEAIEQARSSLSLASYIFAPDAVGRQFVDALERAVKRGVEVRVLIDEVGARYSFPPIAHVLRHADIRTALFMPSSLPWQTTYMNLRSHRKILVADGRVGFTGGINIRGDNVLGREDSDPRVRDMHFRVSGPIVGQLQETFAHDWMFTTGEVLQGETWFPALDVDGPVLARGIKDGPDADYDKLRQMILGAVACAGQSVRIATPYFLPDSALIAALNTAALRGVDVEILLPGRCNLRAVGWAQTAQLWQVLQRGCRVWHTPPPFDHSKVMIVDGAWSLIGSANWDPRSLRLNFEFNIECYDTDLAGELGALLDNKKRNAHALTLNEVDSRPVPIRLRDGIARLFSPYL
jgi:cardiolipin synthase A/B